MAYTYEYQHDPGAVLTVGDLRRALDGVVDETTVMVAAARSPGQVGVMRQVAVAARRLGGGAVGVIYRQAPTWASVRDSSPRRGDRGSTKSGDVPQCRSSIRGRSDT